MEAQDWFAGIAVITAFSSGVLIVLPAMARMRQAARSVRSLDVAGGSNAQQSLWTSLLRNGIPALAPASQRLLRIKVVHRYVALVLNACRLRGLSASETGLTTVVLGVFLAVLAATVIAGMPFFGIVMLAACAIAAAAIAKRAQEAERERLREEIPAVLRSMSACFHAGYTLLQTFRQVAVESNGKLSGYFERAASGLETGKTVDRVLEELRRDADLPELGFVVVALEVQHRTGGSLQHILDAAFEAVEEELSLRRTLRVQTAQARLSARVVTVMPFVLLAVLSLLSQDFLAPFVGSPTGMAVLAVALAMQAAGVVAVRRLLEVRDG